LNLSWYSVYGSITVSVIYRGLNMTLKFSWSLPILFHFLDIKFIFIYYYIIPSVNPSRWGLVVIQVPGTGSQVPGPGPGSRSQVLVSVQIQATSSSIGGDSEFAPQTRPLIYYNIINNCNRITQNLLLKKLINSLPSKIWLQNKKGHDFVT